MSLGETFRLAREKRALTISQVAEATRMMSQIVEDLEREDFRRIAAPIYGRGFIKLYAEYLALEAEPLIREFMEIYAGTRTPQVAQRVVATVPTVEPLDAVQPVPAAPESSGETTAGVPPQPSPAPTGLATPAPTGEPDLFSLAAVRSEAVRSVADPAQAGDTVPPRVRPAAGRFSSSASDDGASARPELPRFCPPGAKDVTPAWYAGVLAWRPSRGQVRMGGGVALLVVVVLLGVRGCKKRPASPSAARAPVSVERVLLPVAPYFD